MGYSGGDDSKNKNNLKPDKSEGSDYQCKWCLINSYFILM